MTKIETLEELWKLANERRAVTADHDLFRGSRVHRPAMFVMQFTGPQLLQIFRAGLYLYEAKTKTPL